VVTDKPFVPTPRAFGWVDPAIVGLLAALINALVTVAPRVERPAATSPGDSLEARYLPLCALFSLSRGVIAYGGVVPVTMVYGYAMARVAGADRVKLPVLDILQSIPALGFLPGFVLGLVHLFPRQNLGLEIASVRMIFTEQVGCTPHSACTVFG